MLFIHSTRVARRAACNDATTVGGCCGVQNTWGTHIHIHGPCHLHQALDCCKSPHGRCQPCLTLSQVWSHFIHTYKRSHHLPTSPLHQTPHAAHPAGCSALTSGLWCLGWQQPQPGCPCCDVTVSQDGHLAPVRKALQQLQELIWGHHELHQAARICWALHRPVQCKHAGSCPCSRRVKQQQTRGTHGAYSVVIS